MIRKFLLSLIGCLFIAATAFSVGCSHATDDDDNDECTSWTSDWSCENDNCTCDDSGDACTHPDDTTEDDADNCDNLCEVCAD